MELYYLICYAAGVLSGVSIFYFGFRLGTKVAYSQANQLPLFDEDGAAIEQDVTD